MRVLSIVWRTSIWFVARTCRTLTVCLCLSVTLSTAAHGTAADTDARAFPTAPIVTFTITTAEGTVTARHDGTVWQIVAPIMTAANQTVARQLIEDITECALHSPSALDTPIRDAHEPQLTLRLQLRDGTIPPRIYIGSTTGHRTAPWMRYEDAPTAVALTADCFQRLHVDFRTLRSMAVVPIPVDAIVQIAVHGSGVGTTVVRDGEAWQMQLPTVSPADRERIQTFLAQLTSLTARAPIDQPAASLRFYGLAPARFTVTFSTRDGRMQTVMFGHGRGTRSQAAQWYARRQHDETILQLDHAPLDQWATALADLRDLRLVVSENPDAIRVLHITRPGRSDMSVLRQPDGQWTLAGPRRAVVDPAAVSRLVTTLTSLRGTSIVADATGNLAAYGLAQPDLTIRAVDGHGVPLGTVMLTRPDAQGQRPSYGMRQGGARVLAFEPWIYDALNLQTVDVLTRAHSATDASQDESWADEEQTPAARTPPGRLRSITRRAAEQ
jgi:hypothetical protein